MKIEVKIPITEEKYHELEVYIWYSFDKLDTYYSRYSKINRVLNKEPVIGIRENNDKFYLIVKKDNEEFQTLLSDVKPVMTLLEASNYQQCFVKRKTGFAWNIMEENQQTLICEVFRINDLYYFNIKFEDYEGEEFDAMCRIEEYLSKYGLDIENKDERSWAEILGTTLSI